MLFFPPPPVSLSDPVSRLVDHPFSPPLFFFFNLLLTFFLCFFSFVSFPFFFGVGTPGDLIRLLIPFVAFYPSPDALLLLSLK